VPSCGVVPAHVTLMLMQTGETVVQLETPLVPAAQPKSAGSDGLPPTIVFCRMIVEYAACNPASAYASARVSRALCLAELWFDVTYITDAETIKLIAMHIESAMTSAMPRSSPTSRCRRGCTSRESPGAPVPYVQI
jgi:hypothetical protein